MFIIANSLHHSLLVKKSKKIADKELVKYYIDLFGYSKEKVLKTLQSSQSIFLKQTGYQNFFTNIKNFVTNIVPHNHIIKFTIDVNNYIELLTKNNLSIQQSTN